MAWEIFLPVLQQVGQPAFTNPYRPDQLMVDYGEIKLPAELRKHKILHEFSHFMRNSRHGHPVDTVFEKPHPWSGARFIFDVGTLGGKVCLKPVCIRQLPTSFLKIRC